MYHALALLAVAILYDKLPVRLLNWAGAYFITGIVFFSGSLYLLTLFKIQESSAVKFLGPVTPLGGALFIAGWVCLLLAAVKNK